MDEICYDNVDIIVDGEIYSEPSINGKSHTKFHWKYKILKIGSQLRGLLIQVTDVNQLNDDISLLNLAS